MRQIQALMIATLLGASATCSVWAGNGGAAGPRPVAPALTQAEAATLSFMREEEKLARDVYLNTSDAYNSVIFANIAKSEQTHMNTMLTLLTKYKLPDPVMADIGTFWNQDLQDLYNELMARAGVSYPEALRVGALIEEVDIEDLQSAITETSKADLKNAYGNLLRGSRNHLRAFVAEIERAGLIYEAQHLPPEVVNAILDTPIERGGSTERN